MGNVKAFSKVHHCVGDVEVAVEERVGDSLVTDKRLTVSLVNSHVHRLCYFFPEAETIILLLFFLPGVLFSLASASPTSWDFDDQLELSKRSMPQVDLFVAFLPSSGDQIRVNQLFGGKSAQDHQWLFFVTKHWCEKLNCCTF